MDGFVKTMATVFSDIEAIKISLVRKGITTHEELDRLSDEIYGRASRPTELPAQRGKGD